MLPYLKRIVENYLTDSSIVFLTEGKDMARREVNRGVPQKFVLGSLLWNLIYNAVLEAALPAGTNITCYADDTLLIVSRRNWTRALRLSEVGVGQLQSRFGVLVGDTPDSGRPMEL